MLTLLSLPGNASEPSLSPFCVKAMCLLHMSGEPWQVEYVIDMSKTPHGKLPVLRGVDRLIPDSGFIQTYLAERGADFAPGLSRGDRAQAHALMRMNEEHLRAALVHDRWLEDAVWQHSREDLFAMAPAPLRRLISGRVRKQVRAAMNAHGIARFTSQERALKVAEDLEAVARQLGDQEFLFGAQPCFADASVLPVLSMARDLPADTPLRDLVRGNAALMAYADRGRARLYPDQVTHAISAAA